MLNPFLLIRRKLRLTQRGLPGLSQMTVYRIENGHYDALSSGMVDALSGAAEDSGVEFEDISRLLYETYGTYYLGEAYRNWRIAHRKENGEKVTWPSPHTLLSEGSPMGRFARLVSGSVTQFCNDFCIQVPTVTRYIEGQYDYVEPPLAIREALSHAEYPDIDELFRLQREWIDRVR